MQLIPLTVWRHGLHDRQSLVQKLVDESGLNPAPQDVEGAIGFVRASADLRQRHGSAPPKHVEAAAHQGAENLP